MTRPTCGSCRFSVPARDGNGKIDFTHRICKFMPPHPLLMPRPDGRGLTQTFVWPVLDTSQSCGQWQGAMSEMPLPGEMPLGGEPEKAD